MFKGGGMPGGMQALMKQANQMQAKMKKMQEELAVREYTGTAGGGAVTVKVNGDQVMLSIQIKPEVFSEGDAEMLQDLILAASNEALKVAKTTHQKEMEKITGNIGLPGLF